MDVWYGYPYINEAFTWCELHNGLIQSSSRKLYLILSMKRWDWSLLFKRDIFNGNITFSVFSDKKHLSLREKGIGEQCGGGWLLSLRNEVQTQPNMFANYSKEKKVGGGTKQNGNMFFLLFFVFYSPNCRESGVEIRQLSRSE